MDSMNARLDDALRTPEPALRDDGFTEAVMRTLPPKRFAHPKARRWTLGIAAASGGLLTLLLGSSLQSAFGSSALAVFFIALVAAPAAWAFHSE